ncbi:MAG: cbb3-type cytochrome c oxidase subunit I [Firmicutes bacterium]|nr:cbb3-type cytochrome c oxidase subunit I [Bacillota bacterium]
MLPHYWPTPVTGDPLIYGADVSIALVSIAILFVLFYYKKWGWLWREWLTTVDHKKIGILYVIAALLMLFRGGVDGLLMRTQLAQPNMHFLESEHYNQVFSTHGTIMILFVAMPFMFALFNIVIPLQIGARDVAFPYLNAISFWMFFFGALLLNISFVIGGSPDAGWVSYAPLTEKQFDPGPGENFYLMALQLSGIGSMATGINFLVTILRMRAPGMTLMRMPLLTWAVLAASIIIIYAFPALTIALALLLIDRVAGAHFFTMGHGGNPMMYTNLFWIWGHPEVYIVLLPVFGVFSEVFPAFSGKRVFGYSSMVASLMAISIVSFLLWAHHFFTMGAGPGVNTYFGIASMAIGIPTGVKVFNWMFTMYRGRIRMTMPMRWAVGFIPNFVIGGATGVMLAAAPGDYQYHNSFFLIAHFHQVLIGGTIYGSLAGMYFWWPKMFGFTLDEKRGRIAFWLWNVGFYVTFFPQYLLGLMGMTRRIYTYPPGMGWTNLNLLSTIGAFLMGLGFIYIVWDILYSTMHRSELKDVTGDPWNARSLEWSLPSPPPHYNFAVVPTVTRRDEWWELKKSGRADVLRPTAQDIEAIHMPNNSGKPIIFSVFFFIVGLGFVFEWYAVIVIGLAGVLATMLLRSVEEDTGHHIPAEEVRHEEMALGRM